MATQDLRDLRAEQVNLGKKRDDLTRERAAAAASHRAAVEALANGTGTAQAVADSQGEVAALDSAIAVLRPRLTELSAEIAPLEAAVVRDRQLRQLRELAERAVAVHAEMLEQRQQSAERVYTLIADAIGLSAGFGGRLRELAQVLADLDALATKLSDTPRGLSCDSHGALWKLLRLSGKDRIHSVLRAQLPGQRNPFHRWVRPEDLPDLGTAGLVLDQLAETVTVRPATPEELAAIGR